MNPVIKQIADHLAKQRDKSTQAGSRSRPTFCAYRGEGETMCAVGCLIPDDLYEPHMERKSAEDVMDEFPEVNKLFSSLLGTNAVDILTAAQAYHDDGQYQSDIHHYTDKTDEELSAHIVGQIDRITQQLAIL